MAHLRSRFAKATLIAGSQSADLSRARRLLRAVLSALVLSLALGVSADWFAPSLRPALAAAAGRNVAALLDARSPGVRLSDALLTKVKSALAAVSHDKPNIASPAPGPRRRHIPPRTRSDPVPADIAADGMAALLAPLEGLESPPEVSGLAGLQPIFVAGGGGGSGGGSAMSADVPPSVASNAPTDAAPLAAVPEPGIWLSMLVGFGLTGAALRRRGSGVNALVAR